MVGILEERRSSVLLKEVFPGVYVIPKVLTDEQVKSLLMMPATHQHHEDDEDDHLSQVKPYTFSWVSELLWPHVSSIRIGRQRAVRVDEAMKIYLLPEGTSVRRHTDRDFYGPDRSMALCSILIYLNNDYSGGETVFNGVMRVNKNSVGGGILFRHNLTHEGLRVTSGKKCILKTDLFFV